MTLGLGLLPAILFLTFWLYKDDLNVLLIFIGNYKSRGHYG